MQFVLDKAWFGLYNKEEGDGYIPLKLPDEKRGGLKRVKEIKVRVEDDLAKAVKRAAQKANTSVNLWIKGLLEETLQGEQSFDYTEAFQKVLADVDRKSVV